MNINKDLTYLISWYDETLESEHKTGVKGCYVEKLVNELKTVEDYKNINVCLHWSYNKEVTKC